MAKNLQQKWLDALCDFVGEREATCPNCGGHNFQDAYVELNPKTKMGFGAFWCQDCRFAFALSRVELSAEELRKKIVPALPDDLKFAWRLGYPRQRISSQTRKAIASVILHGQSEMIPPKNIAKLIRPLIGLNTRQALANVNYRTRLYN